MNPISRQEQRLEERRGAFSKNIESHGNTLEVAAGVYQTGHDTDLFIESVEVNASQDFLEIGCGCGAITIAISANAKSGIACDINRDAVQNTRRNIARLKITNVEAVMSDVFSNISGTYDVIIFNCPYTCHDAVDSIDRMFWDPEDKSKRAFFQGSNEYLRPGGALYFGWADFAGLDQGLPQRLASEAGFKLCKTFIRRVDKHEFNYYVLKYSKNRKG
jgi:methylase of polypeptide subunit release factors